MQKSIIRELFEGNICPSENIFPSVPRYRPLAKKACEAEAAFEKILSKDDFKRFEEYLDMKCELKGMVIEEAFVYGFRLGIMVMSEVFAGKNIIS